MNNSRLKDIVSGSCFLVLGLFLAFRSVGFKIWGAVGPQEGFFSFIIGMLTIGLSLVIIGKSLFPAQSCTPVKSEGPAPEEEAPGSLRKVVYYLATAMTSVTRV